MGKHGASHHKKRHQHNKTGANKAKERLKEDVATASQDPKLPDIPVARFLTGLSFSNKNSCYLNALLHFLASSSKLNAPETTELLQQLKPIGYAFASLFNSVNDITADDDTQYHADAFSLHLARASASFAGSGQRDAHEALSVFLDRLQKEYEATQKRCERLGHPAISNIVQVLLEGCIHTEVTCSTCRHVEETPAPSRIMTLPVAPSMPSGARSASVRESGKAASKSREKRETSKVPSSKGAKQQLVKEEKKKRRDKQRPKNGQHLGDDIAEGSLSAEEDRVCAPVYLAQNHAGALPPLHRRQLQPSGAAGQPIEEPSCAGAGPAVWPQGGAELAAAQSALPPQSSLSSLLAKSCSLVPDIDLAASKSQRHGWSAPWLPGLWVMPDGALFGESPGSSSLLMSLQLFFEKDDIMHWACPRGVRSAARLREERRARRGGASVHVAQQEARERVHRVPGFSEATSRAILSLDAWPQLSAGRQTWERVWLDPDDVTVRKIIQVAMVSMREWFHGQLPSTDPDLNDPAASEGLCSETAHFELTLNDDHKTQYIETHQLAVPPVPMHGAEDLPLPGALSARRAAISEDEYESGVAVVERIIHQAQALLACASDGLDAVGLSGVGGLFGGPLTLRERPAAEGGGWEVHGCVAEPPVELHIVAGDIRRRFREGPVSGGETWLHPAPDEGWSEGDGGSHAASSGSGSPGAESPPPELGARAAGDSDGGGQAHDRHSEGSADVGGREDGDVRKGEAWAEDRLGAKDGDVRKGEPWAENRLDAEATLLSEGNKLLGTGGGVAPRRTARDADENVNVNSGTGSTEAPGGSERLQASAGARTGHETLPTAVGIRRRSCEAGPGAGREREARREGSGEAPQRAGEAEAPAPASETRGSTLEDGGPLCLAAPPGRGILVRSDGGTRQACRQRALERMPPVLLLHFDRARPDAGARGSGGVKDATHVSFPFHLFIHPGVAPAAARGGCAAGEAAVRYRLKAVLVHEGRSMGEGHYICYAWRPTALLQAAAVRTGWAPGRPRPVATRSAPICIPRGHAPGGPRGARRGRRSDSASGSARSAGSSSDAVTLGTGSQSSWPTGRRGGAAGGGGMQWGTEVAGAGGGGHEGSPEDWDEGFDTVGALGVSVSRQPSRAGAGAGSLPQSATSSGVGVSTSLSDGGRWGPGDASNALGSADAQTGAEEAEGDAGAAKDRFPGMAAAELMGVEEMDDVGAWIKCDEAELTFVPWQVVAQAQAYMLMYEACAA